MTEYGRVKLERALANIEFYFGDGTRFTAYELAKKMGVSPDTARRRLIALYQSGVVDFVEKDYSSRLNVILWGLVK
jgi:predicted ArsR family transcriptional regulator